MASSGHSISGVSLGMIIIDEIRMPRKPPLTDVIGGSGSFVTLGQRLFSDNPSCVGCLVLAGHDFPDRVERHLHSLGVTVVLKKKDGASSTRGRLDYVDDTFGPKTFCYTSGPLKSSPTDLVDTPLLHAKAFHFFGTPGEILDQVPELLAYRERYGNNQRPFLVWEPFPASCKPENLGIFQAACKLVDVFSPNHLELTALFSEGPAQIFKAERLEDFGAELLASTIGPTGDGILIVRAGEQGSLTMCRSSRPTWLPTFYESPSSKVIDPTGAGNTFLGGFIAGWQATSSVNEAACFGHVAASFALEQIGLPAYEKKGDKELWNGDSVQRRLNEYKARLVEDGVKSKCFV